MGILDDMFGETVGDVLDDAVEAATGIDAIEDATGLDIEPFGD